ncbi:CBS domain-containing protein [Sporosarcina sp. CAU 1771]
MEIIISHVNTDFDAFSSMIAAKKLYPDAQLVISEKQDDRVRRFFNMYRDTFDFMQDIHVDWSKVTTLIIVDVASLSRIGQISADFDEEKVNIIVYDHHPKGKNDVNFDSGIVEQVGAAVTLLVEEIKRRQLPISEFEATLFGLGIYTDTGNFTYKNTTPRDLQIASYLMDAGMNLEMVQRFSEEPLEPKQQDLLDHLLVESKTVEVDGLGIVVSTYQLEKFQGGLGLLTKKLLEIKGEDAAITVVKMKKHVHIVGRANSNRISLLPLLQKLGGGGHAHAGSAIIKNGDFDSIVEDIIEHLAFMLQPAITAQEIMTHPVKTLTPETTIEEAGRLMYRYGHSGYPIVEEGRLVGIITRRDLDKGNHHGLGHAPVKAYMTTDIVTIQRDTTVEEIQKLIIEHNIGRLPVIENQEIIGIVTRTNIINMLHSDMLADTDEEDTHFSKVHLQEKMEMQLPVEVFTLLKQISQTASHMHMPIYLIGGIVRDMLLDKPNDDIDIVAEGDGILFARSLQEDYGGEVMQYESFGTATWIHPSELSIDITSSRLEYYDRPASLPNVETSTLEDDLQRRDFTINAMAIRLNKETFGELIDPFGGREDLQRKTIKTLHNISFIEDPTRIFRAIRFESRLEFLMDEQTEKLALNSIDKVKNLTPNRIIEEMKRLVKEGDPSKIIQRLYTLNFWEQFGIHSKSQELSYQMARKIQTIYSEYAQNDPTQSSQPSWFTYFLIPFYADSKIDAAERFALTKNDMKLFNELVNLQHYDKWNDVQKKSEYHASLKEYSVEAILFHVSTGLIKKEQLVMDYLTSRTHLQKYLTGEDLVKVGLQQGPDFSNIFFQLEVSQLNGEVTSKEEAVEWLGKNNFRNDLEDLD